MELEQQSSSNGPRVAFQMERRGSVESSWGGSEAEPDSKTPSWFAPLVAVCAVVAILAQYVPFFAFYAKREIFVPEEETDSHFGDLLFLLLLLLVCCAQCFGAAQPFLLLVMLVNVIAVDLPWQVTSAFSSAREVFRPTAYTSTPQPIVASQIQLSIGLIRLIIDVILVVIMSLEMRKAEGRLFVHVGTSEVKSSTAGLFFLCGLGAFLNQVPTLVATFLNLYFFDACEQGEGAVVMGEERYPLTYYFYSIYILLIAGITSRVNSKVLSLLAIISCCTVALLGQGTACIDSIILANKADHGCQFGYHIFAASIYGIVNLLSLLLAALLWRQHQNFV